jgi:hypothetical protein
VNPTGWNGFLGPAFLSNFWACFAAHCQERLGAHVLQLCSRRTSPFPSPLPHASLTRVRRC